MYKYVDIESWKGSIVGTSELPSCRRTKTADCR